ncbi:MAG: tetratricopeptide repeat protein [Bdellovibrionaceae bacterium]|nr:tetratricopeptide repeat protein [Pseudobdellovibrionaceae bacterium]MBX3033048.1 tetratricopeptide repeat protein [Pseudobdellovibrionaceae bacterium]
MHSTRNRFLFLILGLLLSAAKVEAADVVGAMSAQGDITHAEFEGRANWNYDLKRVNRDKKEYAELTVDALDERTVKAMQAFKSDFVRGVRVDPKGPDGRTVVSFELAHGDVESFDYLTDQPSRLIIDFYVSQSSRKAKTAAVKAPAKKETAAAAKDARKPAAADALILADQGQAADLTSSPSVMKAGIFDGGDPDYTRFSMKDYEIRDEAILRSKDNYYIPYPMLMGRNDDFEKVRAAAPVYQISPKDTEENKMARLLLTLFERKRLAVYLKTLNWFKEKFPESSYNDLFAYMTGDVYLQRWEENGNVEDYEHAVQAYQDAILKYPDAPAAERTSLLLGVIALERGDTLGALKYFGAHINHPKFGQGPRFSKDLAQLGMGLSYMKIFRADEALKAFDELEKKSTFKDLKIDAAYRKGDVYTAAKQYVKAIEEYQRALKAYPEGREKHPGAVFNQGEAMFLTNAHRPSLDVFRDFVRQFPTDEHAPFAMTRLAELLEILGADATKVMGAYLETFFRYGENPRAVVARLRMLSARMKGMKPKEVEVAVKEISSLAKTSDLPNIEQFSTVLIADGYTSRKEYDKAIDLLTRYYQQNPTSPDLEPLKRRIVSNIADQFRQQVDAGRFIEALKTHQKYADNWLRGANRLDVSYSLARAFEMAGVQAEAQKTYQDVLNRIHAVKGTPQEKSLRVLQNVPSEESVNLRLAAVADALKNSQTAYEHLRLIKTPEKLSEEEQIERVDLAVRLLERRGDLDSAVRYLTELLKAWQGRAELVAAPYAELARLELKQGKKSDAVTSLKKIDTLAKDSGQVPDAVHARALETLGDLYLETGAKDQAAAVYEDLLKAYEEKRPLASIRYRLGRIYFDRGEPQKASQIWSEFKGEKIEFWQKLAKEQLRNSEWRDDYKKYIQRIPAMVQDNKKE